ncbi:MAG: von Willebrand factor type domain [Bacteroidota bacterium]|jgi:hypothetical protein
MKGKVLSHFFTNLLLLIVGLICLSESSYSQYYDTILVPANSGAVKTSKILRKGYNYKITVSGTVSIWKSCTANDTTPCGVDPMYVWAVDSSEIISLNWPKRDYTIDTVIYEGMNLPKWVGDDKVYPDSVVLEGSPGLRIRLSQDLGLRINNNPLSLQNYNNNHVYTFKKVGDGNPLECKFLDSSSYQQSGSGRIGKYSDNSGEFRIEIVEEPVDSFVVDFCGDPQLDTLNGKKGIRISAKLLKVDSTTNDYLQIKHKELAIYENGIFICPDSTKCEEKTDSSSIVMLFDRSESMTGSVSPNDPTSKIIAAKTSATKFVQNLTSVDKLALFSFGDNVTRDVSWTTDHKQVINAIGGMDKRYGAKTPLYKAIDEALNYLSKETANRKAIVCLTDGINNMEPDSVMQLLNKVKTMNGVPPIYIIALGLDKSNSEIASAIDTLNMLAVESKGRKYESYDQSSLDDIYGFINSKIQMETCCTIYYSVPDCQEGKGDTERTVSIYYNNNGKVSFAQTKYKTKCSTYLIKNEIMNSQLKMNSAPILTR